MAVSTDVIDPTVFDLGIDNRLLSEYVGPWAMEPERFQRFAQMFQEVNIREHVAANKDFNALGEGSDKFAVSGGIAQIEIIGVMQKYGNSMGSAAATTRIRRQVRAAASDNSVRAIILRMDTPGGTVSGTKDLADEVARAAAIKPVIAFADDLLASAGIWVASQATEIVANQSTAAIGSIGTYGVVTDLSGQAEKLGIKVHVVGAGEFKGSGTPGTEITDAQLQERMRIVTALNNEFKAAVAIGRSFSSGTIDELADGRLHTAPVALDLGLIDKIQSFEETLSQFSTQTSVSVPRSESVPTTDPNASTEPQVASLAQLEGICDSSDFVLEQLKVKATVAQATGAYADRLKTENERLVASHAEEVKAIKTAATETAQAEAQAAADAAASVDPLKVDGDASADGDGDDPVDDPIAAFSEKVELAMGKMSDRIPEDTKRLKAVGMVARRQPELHQAYLAATNSTNKKKRLLAEKYE